MSSGEDRYLLDTNVISEFASGQPHQQVLSWFQAHKEDVIFLSGVTIGELQKGISRLPDSKRKTQLEGWLNNTLMAQYEGYILPADVETFKVWGTISAEAEKAGQKMQVVDALIAAFAKQHRLKLVTRNVSDFTQAGIDLVNPWEA